MPEPTIICPKCKNEIKLTESLAAPLIESTKRNFEARLIQKDTDIVARENILRDREDSLAKERENVDQQVAVKLKLERNRIVAEEAKKAQALVGNELEQKANELKEMQSVLKAREGKLAEAQLAQTDLLRKQRELDDAKRELDLNIEKRIQAGLEATRQQARKEADDALRLKVAEKELTISSMQKQIEDLRQRAEQGSQQLQGEVQELELEAILRAEFPRDTIEPVPKGTHGGDALQRVMGPLGQLCGTILWESKRTKNWSDSWLAKLRDDQRAAQAAISVLVTQVLPKDVESFSLVEGVWVIHPKVALPVALILRQSLVDLAIARQAIEGQQTKVELLYAYLTGPKFHQRVQALVEGFSGMKEELEKERRVITKQWAKRDEQITRIMHATVGMYGDMQGISGKTLQEIDILEFKALEEGNASPPVHP